MVAHLMSVNEDTELSDLHDVFQQVLGWQYGAQIVARADGFDDSCRKSGPAAALMRRNRHLCRRMLRLLDCIPSELPAALKYSG